MKYEAVIGLEIHSELLTKTKLYCDCPNEFGGEENTHCCPICIGMPGTLPVINRKAIEYCIKAGLALNCEIIPVSKQDRKNYFYPDLPKAYQVSQFDNPICGKGYVDIEVNGQKKRIGITRIHLEEDAGKLIHTGNGTMIDYNRCGVPLIEIVTEPDIRTSEEARILLETIRNILMYIEVSDGKMQEGSLRCDINLSVRPEGLSKYGTRTEMKNVNSFRGATRAIEYEYERQVNVIENGGIIEQETRRWDDTKAENYVLRTKEDAEDYRYLLDPDLVPIKIDDSWINEIKRRLPELPLARKDRFIREYSLTDYEASIIVQEKVRADFFEECVKEGASPKEVSNWILGEVLRITNEKGIGIPFSASYLVQLIEMIDNGEVSGTAAKNVLEYMFEEDKEPRVIARERDLGLVSDEDEIREVVVEVIKGNHKCVEDYKAGKGKVVAFLIGKCMGSTKGRGNPEVIRKVLLDILSKL